MNTKLFYIIPSLDYGGAELQSIAQINYLHQHGYDIHLLVLSEIKNLKTELQLPKEQITVLHFPYSYVSMQASVKSVQLIAPILKLLQQKNINCVIAHLPLSHFVMRLVVLAQKLLLRPPIRLFPYHHSMQYEANPLDTLGKRLFNTVNSVLARFTDTQNICVSNAVKENIQAHIFLQKPQIIFNSIAQQNIDARLAQQYLAQKKISSKEFTILFPGRLHPSKGHLFFLTAFQKMVQQLNWTTKKLQVIIAGGEGIITDIEAAISAAQLNDFFHITGTIPNPLLLSLYKIADVTVIPSINEGFGIVAIEALMQGCQVLCSDAGGLKEVIQDGKNGWQFPKLAEEAFLQKMALVYKNRHQPILTPTQLIKDYHQRFTLQAQMEQLLSLVGASSQ